MPVYMLILVFVGEIMRRFLALILCIVLFAIKATGPVMHIVAGVMLTVVSVSHLWSRIRRMSYLW